MLESRRTVKPKVLSLKNAIEMGFTLNDIKSMGYDYDSVISLYNDISKDNRLSLKTKSELICVMKRTVIPYFRNNG